MRLALGFWVLLVRGAGRVLNALFGWSIDGIFGRTPGPDRTLLSGLLALAVAWPVFLVELLARRAPAIAVGEMPGWLAAASGRLAWLALVVAVPITVGSIFAMRTPPGAVAESPLKAALRGFPITIGLALGFLWTLVAVPALRLADLARRHVRAHLILSTPPPAYYETAAALSNMLVRHGLRLERGPADVWTQAPVRLLNWLGGNALSAYLPPEVERFSSAGLIMAFFPFSVLLRGQRRLVTGAHAVLVEAIIETLSLETTSRAAQTVERRIRSVWQTAVLSGQGQAADDIRQGLAFALPELVREMADLDIEAEEEQALYRQLLQLDRTLRGAPQLLESEPASSRARFDENARTVPAFYRPEIEMATD